MNHPALTPKETNIDKKTTAKKTADAANITGQATATAPPAKEADRPLKTANKALDKATTAATTPDDIHAARTRG